MLNDKQEFCGYLFYCIYSWKMSYVSVVGRKQYAVFEYKIRFRMLISILL